MVGTIQFILSSFWNFIGTLILIAVISVNIIMIVQSIPDREVKVILMKEEGEES